MCSSRTDVERITSHYFSHYQRSKEGFVPEFVTKRMRNHHIPGHSEIMVYAFHNHGLFDKNFLRKIYDPESQKATISKVFSTLIEDLTVAKPISLSPGEWSECCKAIIYRGLGTSGGSMFSLNLDRENVWARIHKTSASGAPYFVKKGELRKEFDEIFDSILNKSFDRKVFDLPNMIYMVTQPSKTGKLKQRLIFCPPLAVTILELVMFSKVCDYFTQNSDSSLMMGNSQLQLFEMCISMTKYAKTSGDYSSYDRTIPSNIICMILKMFSFMIDFNDESVNSYREDLF